jgi:hypothetical protein
VGALPPQPSEEVEGGATALSTSTRTDASGSTTSASWTRSSVPGSSDSARAPWPGRVWLSRHELVQRQANTREGLASTPLSNGFQHR